MSIGNMFLAAQVAEETTKKSGAGPIIVVSVIFAILIVGGLIFGLVLMQKQKNAEAAGGISDSADMQGKEGIKKNTSNQTVYDTRGLVEMIENVEDGIIVTDGGKRFVAAITCRGLDFYNEGLAEQLSTMNGYQNFLNLIERPITYRLYSKAVDIDSSKNRYATKLEETIELFDQSSKELQLAKDRGASEDRIRELTDTVERYQRRIEHLNEQMEYMQFYSGTDVVMDVTQDYIIDWTYEPGVNDVKLTGAELFLRAKRELNTIASQKIDALAQSGVKGRMCTQDEIVDMLRRHSKPLSAEQYKQRMVSSSSFEEDIVSSTSIEEAYTMRVQELYESMNDEDAADNLFSGKGEEYDDEE